MTLTVNDLFTPATAADYLQKFLDLAKIPGSDPLDPTLPMLQTTSWQSGSPTRTIIAILTNILASSDDVVSVIAQGGFLDTAALVTPEPVAGTFFSPGWLDVLAKAVYNVDRAQATYAENYVSLVNGSGTTYGPYQPGTYHVANPTTGQTYTNVNPLTVPPGSTSALFKADALGSLGNAGANTITKPITSLVGVTIPTSGVFSGSDADSNSTVVLKCRAKLGALSLAGSKGAYQLYATTFPAPSPMVPVSSGNRTIPDQAVSQVQVNTDPYTGNVTVLVANTANGSYSGADSYTGSVAKSITASASNAGKVQFHVVGHGYSTNDRVFVSGHSVVGYNNNPASNDDQWTITVDDADHFTVSTLTWTADGTGGTSYRVSDLDLIDRSVQAYAVPEAVTATTVSATVLSITIVADVWVPAAYLGVARDVIQKSLTTYLGGVPIGGTSLPGATPNALLYDVVMSQIFAASSAAMPAGSVKQVTNLTVNGGTSDVTLSSTEVPRMPGVPTLTIHAV